VDIDIFLQIGSWIASLRQIFGIQRFNHLERLITGMTNKWRAVY